MPDEKTIEPEPPAEELEVEFTTREEYINCACNALNSVAEFNVLTKADEARKKRITRRCMRILDDLVSEMYGELFESEEED